MKNLIVFDIELEGPTWEAYRKVPIEFEQEPVELLKKRFAKIISIHLDEIMGRAKPGDVNIKIEVLGGLPKEPEWLYLSCTSALALLYRAIELGFDKPNR